MPKVYFISDIHLGAGYIADRHAHERRVARFLDAIADDATELYLLGDILDYWYEYRTVVPRGYVRFFGAMARLADRGVKITWLTGNHDIWLFDYIRDEIGVDTIDAPYIIKEIGGHRFLLGHGDRIGRRSLPFRFICSVFRNRVCQKLYSGIHPRWTVPLAHLWSYSSRKGATAPDEKAHELEVVADMEHLLPQTGHVDYVVIGHHHIAVDTMVGDTQLVVLGDWIKRDTYAVYDGTSLNLRTFKP